MIILVPSMIKEPLLVYKHVTTTLAVPTLSNSPVVLYRIAETTNSKTSQLMTQRKGNGTVYIPPRKDSIAVERK